MPQRLQQAENAVCTARSPHQDRAHQTFAQFTGQIVEYLVARRLDVLQQLLHQLVVMIGKSFEHGKARGLFPVGGVAFERDDFRGGVFLVDKGAFEREIDKAADDFAGKCRDLPQHELSARRGLQERSTS
jgi:hypothetical protein